MNEEQEKREISTNTSGEPTHEIAAKQGPKRCVKCKSSFPMNSHFFHRDPNSPDGFRNECIVCRKGGMQQSEREKRQKDEIEQKTSEFDKKFLKFIEDIPSVEEVDAVPHSTLLYERMVHYFGGADGIARHLSMVYLSGTPAIRARILSKMIDLGVKASEDGHARLPVELLETEDLERELAKRIKLIEPKVSAAQDEPGSEPEDSQEDDDASES